MTCIEWLRFFVYVALIDSLRYLFRFSIELSRDAGPVNVWVLLWMAKGGELLRVPLNLSNPSCLEWAHGQVALA